MRNRILTLISILAAVSFSAAAQPPERFIQVDSVIITHQPLEFEIRHRILPVLDSIGFAKDDSQYLSVDISYFFGSDSATFLKITAHDDSSYMPFYAYDKYDPDFLFKPVGYCRIEGYLFMFYVHNRIKITEKHISPVPWKHRTLKLEVFLPFNYDPPCWDFLIYDYSIIHIGNIVY